MASSQQLDVLGTFLRTLRSDLSVETVLQVIHRMGPKARLAEVCRMLGLPDEVFAKVLDEAEREGLVMRVRDGTMVSLALTDAGLDRLMGRRRA